jgi:RNA polymerase sigma factor (sigma-70 family)
MSVATADQVLEELFREHSRALLAYALRRVERSEDAADVVSETMLIAWRRLGDVPAGAEARLWLFGVARRVLSNLHRAERRRHRLGERLREHLSGVVVDHAEDVETSAVVRRALGRLPDPDRELLMLTAWEGLSPSEIAVVTATPPATVRTRLHRARRRLRVELEALGWHEERNEPSGHEVSDGRVLVRFCQEEEK